MREKFEFYTKIIGLVFFCFGALYALSTIPLFFQKAPDVTQLIPASAMKMFSQADIADMQSRADYLWKHALKMFFFFGIVPMALGVYLMTSNNLFVRFCYPARSLSTTIDSSKDISLHTNAKETDNIGEHTSENKYAPPGYFQ